MGRQKTMHRLSAAAAVLTLAIFGVVSASDVVVGNEKNFDQLVSGSKFVLAEFYAPWCGHCKNLEPEYEKAAATLKTNPDLKLVKVDATQEKALAEKYAVQGFPTLKFFVSGKAQEYGGGRDHDSIVQWLKKKTGPSTVKLTDKASLDAFAKDHEAVLLGLFQDGDAEFAEFEKAAAGLSIPVGVTADPDLAQQYTPSKVVMVQKFDDKLAKYSGAMSSGEIAEWATANSMPLVIQFTQETEDKIFGEDAPKRHVLALHSEGYTDKANLDRELAAVAKEYRGKFLVISVEKVQDNEGVFNFFGVSDASKPTIISIDQSKSGMKKFFYDGEQEHHAIKAWLADVLAGKLDPVLKSEEPPADNNGPVKVVVGKTFKQEVVESGKDVMMEFYAPWCGHCKALEPEYNALGEAFKGVDSVVIAKMDATANEIEEPEVQGFPTLYFYKAGAKEPVKYHLGRTAKEMEKYIRSNAASLQGGGDKKEL